MKKSALTLAVAGAILASQSASAAVVYDKDGTELAIGGRVQAVFYNGNNEIMDNKDHTIADNVRLNVSGRTKLYEGIYGFGFWEHQWQHAGDSSSQAEQKARDAYVGVEFEHYGSLRAGRYSSAAYYVTEITDVFEDYGCAGTVLDDQRNSGKVSYAWSGYGIDFNIDYQTAVNNFALPGYLEDEVDVNGGFAVSAGYTTPDVLFGPISIRAGYEYLKGQNEGTSPAKMNNVKSWTVGLSWGGEEGPYLAGHVNVRDFKLRSGATDDDDNALPDYKAIGYEVVAGYSFACGVSIVAGFESLKYDFDNIETENELAYRDYTSRKVPVYVNYQVNPNFNVWTEAQFDANSSNLKGADNERIVSDKTLFALGARYSF